VLPLLAPLPMERRRLGGHPQLRPRRPLPPRELARQRRPSLLRLQSKGQATSALAHRLAVSPQYQLLRVLHQLLLHLLLLPLRLQVPRSIAQPLMDPPTPVAAVLHIRLSATPIAMVMTVRGSPKSIQDLFANLFAVPGGTSYANSLDECVADCDNTDGCVDVSYNPGSPGPCYKKSSVAEIRQNDNIFGALRVTRCTNTKLKLHRKRVVRSPTMPKKVIQKRGVYGPDFTYTQGTTTVTQRTTSTSVRYATV
jgi:hypothetical protein